MGHRKCGGVCERCRLPLPQDSAYSRVRAGVRVHLSSSTDEAEKEVLGIILQKHGKA